MSGKHGKHIAVNTVIELKSIALNEGEEVRTFGYYGAGDGGGATYKIVADSTPNSYTVFETANGLYAKLIVDESMNVLQFGAVPLDIDNYDTDQTSHEQLSIAFNGTVTNLNFPQNSNFLISEKITVSDKVGLNIVGNNSTLFTDNSYILPMETHAQSFLYFDNCQDVNYESLNMTCRETISLQHMEFQFRVRNTTNMQIKNSVFRGPGAFLHKNTLEDLKNGINVNERYYEAEDYVELPEEINMSNIDIYSGCHDIYIDNCELYLSHDGPAGLCYMVRDMSGLTTTNVHFTNNYCEKISHDEIIATGMSGAILSELYFENNTFVMFDGIRTQSLIAVSFGSGAVAEKIRNMYIRNNNFFLQSSLYGIVFEEVDVLGSEIVFEGNYVDSISGGNAGSNAFYSIRTFPDTEHAVVLSEVNEFHIRNSVAVQKTVECFRNMNLRNQNIFTDGSINAVISRSEYVENCTFVVTDKVSVLFSRVPLVYNNKISLDFATYILQYAGALGSITMEQNRIEYLKEIDANYFNVRLNSATINDGETILVKDNEYILTNPERGGSYLVDVLNSTYPSTTYNMVIFENNVAKKTDGSIYDFYLAYRFIRGIDVGYVAKF